MSKSKNKVITLSATVGLAVAAITFFASYFFIQVQISDSEREIRKNAKTGLEKVCTQIDQSINEKLFLAKSLAAFVQYDSSFKPIEFQNFAAEIYQIANQEIQAVQLVKDSIISYNYPKKGNEASQGKNILNINNDRALGQASIDNKEAVLIGPRKLLQGSVGLVYREPILINSGSKNEQLWGFAAIVINLDQLIDNNLIHSQDEISVYSDHSSMFKQGFFIGDSSILSTPYVEANIHLPNRDWLFFMSIEEEMQIINKERSFLLWLAFFLALTFGFISSKEVYNFQKAKSLNSQLQLQNHQIKKQLDEKALLIKEIHHRIKNHFQLFSSLNRVKYMETEDPKVREILDEIESRIFSLSEAYGQLQTNSNGNSISLKEYISSLTRNLIRNSNDEIEVDLEMCDLLMEIKKVVQIGVIVNEWLTNSLKYAFNDNDNPKIKLTLQKTGNQCKLEFLDNGGKLPKEVLNQDHNSSGIDLTLMFAQQLEAKLEEIHLENGLNGFRLSFSK